MSVSATRVVFELGLRLGDIGLRRSAAFEAGGSEPQRFGIRFDSVVEQALLRIGGAQLEVVVSQFGMEAETGGFQVRRGGLRFFARGVHGAAYAAPRDLLRRTGRRASRKSPEGAGEVVKNGRLLDTRSELMDGAVGDGRELGSTMESDHVAGLAKSRFGGFQVLIAGGELLFQGVQLSVAENLPPVAANGLVAGLRGFHPSPSLKEAGGASL